MEEEALSWLIPTSIFLVFSLLLSSFILKRQQAKQQNLPPSPPSFPIIGHFHLLKEPLHRCLHELNEKYGHIVFLRFGSWKVLVVSSPSAVEECFTKNDIIFANRPLMLAGKHLNYNSTTMGFSSYGDHWRNLRRLTTVELLSSNRLAMFTSIREDEVRLLVKQLFGECKDKDSAMDLRPKFVELSFNIMLRMISGKRYYGKEAVAQEAKEFQNIMAELLELLRGNLNDFFPVLQWIDFKGVEKKMLKLMTKVDRFLQNLLDENRRNRSMYEAADNQRKMTLIGVMLDLQETEPEFYTDETIKGVILTLAATLAAAPRVLPPKRLIQFHSHGTLVAGSETSAITMEWALALLLNHPKSMQKVKAEIDFNVGQNRLTNELDLSKLIYLQYVINETLRLFPVAPLLLPHKSSNDCKVCGFDVPKGTTLFVNLWSLHRDANLWDDPTRFLPERFEGEKVNEVYKLIPFGVGRRACPGGSLAKRVMGNALAAMIQSFEWERIENEEINMVEGIGLTMPKVKPLVALCRPRQVMINVLLNL